MEEESIIKSIQEKELDLLKVFDEICKKNNLKYFSLGGTLLGAVRHKGFIPWDDDMDLGMPREDYNKFINFVSQQLPRTIELRIRDENLASASIIDLGSKFASGNKLHHPFIDIFPLDGFPKEGIETKIHYLKIGVLRVLSKLSVIDQLVDKDRGILGNCLVKILKMIKITSLMNTKKINNTLQKLISKYDYNNSPRVGNVLGRYKMKEIVNKDIMGKPIYLKFHDFSIPAPQNPDMYLTSIYGNYMKLPDEKNRESHFEIK